MFTIHVKISSKWTPAIALLHFLEILNKKGKIYTKILTKKFTDSTKQKGMVRGRGRKGHNFKQFYEIKN